MDTSRICVEGQTCWRRPRAERLAFLVDGDAYFSAFVEAASRAEHVIYMLGWDIQGTARLRPGAMPDGLPPTLREFLNALLRRRRTLHAYLLDWDYAFIFAAERELFPMLQLGWRTHRRLHFGLDAEHPFGGSHHQKIVVVDDAVAFAGGLDVTVSRWDTPAHHPVDPARVLPDGAPYGPFHDVQIAVSGEAAQALGTLARERWRRATGVRLPAPPAGGGDPWPPGLTPDLIDVPVALARTEPAFEGHPEVREVEALYLASIAAAERVIYLESQYFTSHRIGAALAARLAEPDGPEVVCVMPRTCSGWLEESTMGILRARLVRTLRAADHHDRLRVYYPQLTVADDVCLNVHSKVMIVDDRLARIASSNLSNRSMGLDTECDVILEATSSTSTTGSGVSSSADGTPRVAAAIASLRTRLLAEHLDVAPDAVDAALATTGSLVRAVESLRSPGRTLAPLPDSTGWLQDTLPDVSLVDLERPLAHAVPLAQFVPTHLREPALRGLVRIGLLGVGVAIAIAVVATLGSDASFADLVGHWRRALGSFAVLVPLAFVLGTAVRIPLSVLLAATMLVLGPLAGAAYGLLGVLVAATVAYAVGRVLPTDVLVRLAGRHFPRLRRRLAHAGIEAVAMLRLLPMAPLAVVSLVAGGRRLGFVSFAVGTLLGTLPGAAALAALVGTLLP